MLELKPEFLAAAHSLLARARAVEAERVLRYWHLGQLIFEEQQHGAARAAYGSNLLKGLAAELQP